jgi:hypothetical protein
MSYFLIILIVIVVVSLAGVYVHFVVYRNLNSNLNGDWDLHRHFHIDSLLYINI